MSGFEDSFNASGRRKSRNKKAISIAKKTSKVSTPLGLGTQLADEATKSAISNQVKETWSIDGFDNADGVKKSFTTEQKIGLILVAAVAIVGGTLFMISRLNKKTTKA